MWVFLKSYKKLVLIEIINFVNIPVIYMEVIVVDFTLSKRAGKLEVITFEASTSR